jgi:hypothetical protein
VSARDAVGWPLTVAEAYRAAGAQRQTEQSLGTVVGVSSSISSSSGLRTPRTVLVRSSVVTAFIRPKTS